MKSIIYTLLFIVCGLALSAQIPTSGLLAHYPFNNNLNDTSVNAHNLVNVGSASALTYVAGHDTINTGIDLFNGNLCARLQKGNVGFNDSTITVAFWAFTPSANLERSQNVFVARNSTNDVASFVVEINTNIANDLQVRFISYHSANYLTFTALQKTYPAGTFTNQWHHLAFTLNSGAGSNAISMYVDGQFVQGQGANLVKGNAGSNRLDLAVTQPFCITLTQLDELLVYTRALTASEVGDIYDEQYTGLCLNTIAATIPATRWACPAFPLTIPAAVTAGLNLNFQWFKGGQPIANSNNDTLILPASATNNGNYTVRITSSCDTVTVGTTVVTMVDANLVPTITQSSGQLICSITDGTGYNWYLNGVLYASNIALSTVSNSGPGTYTVEVVYTANGNSCTSARSAGELFCPVGTSVSAISLNWSQTGAPSTGRTSCENPLFGTQIIAVTTGASQRTFQWFKDGQPIAGATNASYNFTHTLSAAGIYSYRVAGPCDTAFSTNFAMVILPRPAAPSISATGNVLTATGANTTGYVWYLNGIQWTAQTQQTYTAANSGTYTVQFFDSNSCGSLQSADYNHTLVTPGCNNTISIFGGTLSGAFCENASFTLNMTPTINSGTNLSYQWFKNNVLILGATNLRYEFQALVANNGTYSILVTSNCDTVTYGNLLVDITARPTTPIITANGSSLNSNSSATSYQWFLDGVLIAGNTQSITAAADGAYLVVATASGCSSDTSAPYNYVANADCGFATTYTIASGNCPNVSFGLDGATAPITTSITYGIVTTPLVASHTGTSFTIDEFCAETYVVVLADANGCLDTVTFTITEVGISQVNNITLSIYPNPANQTLAISASETLTGVQVYNIMGQQVLSIVGNATQIDVTTLPAGTYHINAKTNTGSVRKPFVKY